MSFSLTSNIDLAEILFTLFWLFFIGLVIFLRREDKREGYPLESERSGSVSVQGFPAVPRPKEFQLAHGGTQTAPRAEPVQNVAATPAAPHPGAPLVPTGDPLVDGVGPASYANRSDTPDKTFHGDNRVVPLRVLDGYEVSSGDADPRGMPVVAADGETVGTVADLWIDRSEPQVYFLEVQRGEGGSGTVMVPFAFASLDKRRGRIDVDALYSQQFANVPALRSPDEITLLEEDKICAYFSGGTLYADASRQEPLL